MPKAIRPLYNLALVENFVENVLDIHPNADASFQSVCHKILTAELQLENIESKSTLNSPEFRDGNYRQDNTRKQLREKILHELSHYKRLKKDDSIRLGRGGALPITGVQKEKQAYYIIGLPASGKSCITNQLADQFGAVVLDSDYAKRKLPEFDMPLGAALTHEESSAIIFGMNNNREPCLLACTVSEGINIVIPKIGSDYGKALAFSQALKNLDYSVHLILVRLDRLKATRRAYNRFKSSGRYVALPLIVDGYANEPTIVYYDLKRTSRKLFASFSMISTDVERGKPPKILELTGYSPFKKFQLK